MLRRRQQHEDRPAGTRDGGQSLVEFALLVPVLAVLMLTALDFGRVYLGWVNLQNMTRIAANFAANDPDAWQGSLTAAKQATRDRYETIVLNDARATNCDLPGNPDNVEDPDFEDRNGDGDARDLGDLVRVQLTCDFRLITPGISAIVGNPLAVSAEAVFPIKNGLAQTAVASGSTGGGGGLPPTVAFAADVTSGEAPLTVAFNDESGGAPTSWTWNFGDASGSNSQDPTHTYTAPGVYDVTLTASNSFGSGTLTKTSYIVVGTPPAGVAFEADKTSGTPGVVIRFTDTSTSAPTAWLWDFGDGKTSTTQNPVNTYSAAGSYDVTLTITTPTGTEMLTKTGYINVAVGLCTVPDFTGAKFNSTQATWEARGFTTAVERRDQSNKSNFTVVFQSLTGNSQVPCSSTIQLDD